MNVRYWAYLAVIMLLASCEHNTQRNVITYKSYSTPMNDPLPLGLCRFQVGGGSGALGFTDSCHFYHMLDTIK